MIAETYEALKSRLEAHPQLADIVFDSVLYDGDGRLRTDPYVIVYPSIPEEISSGRYTAVADFEATGTFVYDVRTVGPSAAVCARLTDKVLAQLLGHRLVVEGRRCDPITLDSSGDVRADAAVKPPLFYADMGFELVNRPA
jgi:hypothetical protein